MAKDKDFEVDDMVAFKSGGVKAVYKIKSIMDLEVELVDPATDTVMITELTEIRHAKSKDVLDAAHHLDDMVQMMIEKSKEMEVAEVDPIAVGDIVTLGGGSRFIVQRRNMGLSKKHVVSIVNVDSGYMGSSQYESTVTKIGKTKSFLVPAGNLMEGSLVWIGDNIRKVSGVRKVVEVSFVEGESVNMEESFAVDFIEIVKDNGNNKDKGDKK